MEEEQTMTMLQTEVEDEQEFHPNEVERLQEHGINVADINKLKAAGLTTVLSIIMANKKDLLNIKGISEAKLDKIMDSAMKIENAGFITGNQLREKRKQILHITTGSTALDEMLGGGLESQAITEIYGEYRSGKSQLCMTMAVTAQLPKPQGGAGKVLYIDAEGSFRPERIAAIAQRYDLVAEEVLDNIIYARAHTTEHQHTLLVLAAAQMMEDHFAIIIIDNIMGLYRVDYSGRGQLSERQQNLGQFLAKLKKLGEQFNVAILITNQVMADPGGGMSFMADPKKPIGGHVLAHASTTRLYFKKGKGEQRIIKCVGAPCVAETQCTIEIAEGGVTDPNE